MSFKGIALVTGAAQGIGRGVALRFADDGYTVAVNDLGSNSEKLDSLVDEIQNKGRASSKYIADVSLEGEVKDMVDQVVRDHGGLDVMVANAGIGGPIRLPFIETSAEQWDRVMSVNARGPFLCYKYAGLQMIKQGRGGRIIGASSFSGKQGVPTKAAYSASRFAVRGLTQVAAQEFGAHGITVNAYAPGLIDTPMGTLAAQDDWDVASLVSFLASAESQFITGQTISINGGIFFD
ncbi:acetoin reductase family protein [Mycena pura]|uniref:Acetoin reductase family protein n=1 Tax=Mycena pura TaxID=153505 RepID=A0AAD6VXH2_9AGAR|nr:acetoin reductase family protein [Mycena pura]